MINNMQACLACQQFAKCPIKSSNLARKQCSEKGMSEMRKTGTSAPAGKSLSKRGMEFHPIAGMTSHIICHSRERGSPPRAKQFIGFYNPTDYSTSIITGLMSNVPMGQIEEITFPSHVLSQNPHRVPAIAL